MRARHFGIGLLVPLGASVLSGCSLLWPRACETRDVWEQPPTPVDVFGDGRDLSDGLVYFVGGSSDLSSVHAFDPAIGDAITVSDREMSSLMLHSFDSTGGRLLMSGNCGSGLPKDRGAPELFALSPDGTEVQQLTKSVDPESLAGVSSSGDLIFTERAQFDDSELRVRHSDGSFETLTENEVEESRPVLSPDGESVAYRRTNDLAPATVGVMDLGTRAEQVLLLDEVLAWMPDGQTLIGRRADTVVRMDVPSGSVTEIAAIQGEIFTALLSPDGSNLALILRSSGDPDRPVVLDVNSGVVQPVPHLGSEDRLLAWAPDGGRLLVAISDGAEISDRSHELAIVHLADGSVTPTGHQVVRFSAALWIP
jgi:Tol biopolymer transport system component